MKQSLENMAASIVFNDEDAYPGFGYQIGGLKVYITVNENNVNNRITQLLVKTANGEYEDIDLDKVELIYLNRYIHISRDGNCIFGIIRLKK